LGPANNALCETTDDCKHARGLRQSIKTQNTEGEKTMPVRPWNPIVLVALFASALVTTTASAQKEI